MSGTAVTPLASVLIVNFNGAKHLPACLDALEKQSLPRGAFEVILLDNDSRDDSVELVRERFPWVRLIALPYNSGFADGNNIAAKSASCRTLVLLNNDTIPDPHWLEELLRTANEHPGCNVASKLVFAHDPGLVNSAGAVLLRDGRGADRGFRQRDIGQYEAEGPTFAGCGAALLVTARVGEPLLDPRYFVYYEDLDAGWRLRLAGRGCQYAPRSVVRHVHGAAAGDQSPLFWFYVERNRALTALRNADPFLALWAAFLLFAKVGQAIYTALKRGRGPKRRWPVAWAVVRAATAYLWMMPTVLVERYMVRNWRVRGKRCAW